MTYRVVNKPHHTTTTENEMLKSKQFHPAIFRQGDVLLQLVAALPENAKDVTPQDRIVLAYGEVTGHAHAVYEPEGKARLWDAGAERFLQVMSSTSPLLRGEIVDRDDETLRIKVASAVSRNGFVKCRREDVREVNGGLIATGAYALMQHEEHDAHLLLNGIYRHRGAQREYEPEGIRNVED